MLGLGVTGSPTTNGSGEYVIAFSTEATRAAELFAIQREIQRQKVEAARERAAAEREYLPIRPPVSEEVFDEQT